jgi:uncharacterized membrane protein
MLRIAAQVFVVVLILVSIAQSLYYFPLLPDQVASHFGPNGQPNGFSSKTTYTWSMLGVNVGIAAMLLGLAKTIKYLPNSLINLPHKDYWLHPDRRASSLQFVEMNLLGVAASTLCLFIAIAHLTFDANMRQAGLSPRYLGVIIALFVFSTTGNVIWLLLRFSRPGPS